MKPYTTLEVTGKQIEVLDLALKKLIPAESSRVEREGIGFRRGFKKVDTDTYEITLRDPRQEMFTRKLVIAANFVITLDCPRTTSPQDPEPASPAVIEVPGKPAVTLRW